jgi:hypothetical protein
LLIDEVDNADLGNSALLRAVLNSGHCRGGCVIRVIDGEPKRFSTFSPIAIAAIGNLPLPLTQRSIVIRMQRADGARNLRRLDDVNATVDLDLAYRHVFLWARTAKLNPDPAMPVELTNRAADNWRPLLSVAATFGPDWEAKAREAAIYLQHECSDEDIGVMLLVDIRRIFNAPHVSRVSSADLVGRLTDLDDTDWREFRGRNGDEQPRPLSQIQLATLLRPFGIRSKSVWYLERPRRRSQKGYTRDQFRPIWARYCPENGKPAQSSNVKYLRRRKPAQNWHTKGE